MFLIALLFLRLDYGLHRYLFYATPHRLDTEEYSIGDEAVPAPVTEEDLDALEKIDDKVEPFDDVKLDPALADWFQVKNEDGVGASSHVKDNSDTETEDDSDHESLPPGDVDDDWQKVEPIEAILDVEMGEASAVSKSFG